MNVKDKLSQLQEILKNNHWDAFMFSSADEYINEYVPDCFKRLEYLTNFSGSFGFCIITQNKAVILVDGRYTLAVKQQVDTSIFEIMDYSLDNISKFLQNNLSNNAVVCINSKVVRIEEFMLYDKMLTKLNMKLISSNNHLVDLIWKDQPQPPTNSVFDYDVAYAGLDRLDKISQVKKYLLETKMQGYLITQLDNIAWLLNLRGEDVECNPLFLSQLLVKDENKSILFIDKSKLSNELLKTLEEIVEILPQSQLNQSLLGYIEKHKIAIANNSPYYYLELLKNAQPNNCSIVEDFVSALKAPKNKIELNNTKLAHIRDGSYIIKSIKYVYENLNNIDEIGLSNHIITNHKFDSKYKMESFPAIVGSNGNGAIVHYRADENSNAKILDGGYLLLDCGGQYLDGTTDITRSFAFCENPEYKKNYTATLKGHIDLAKVIFKVGTKGCELDILARSHLWNDGKDYMHGTGHGVGVYLSVHETGARISSFSNVVLQEGMILSNEPGFYVENKYGIRLENLYFVKKSKFNGFLELENLTYVPFEMQNIDLSLLDASQLKWLNNYHLMCYQHAMQAKILNAQELKWLKDYMKI